MSGDLKIFPDEAQRGDGYRQEADFAALSLDAQMGHAFPMLDIPYLERNQLGLTDAVIKKGGQDRPVPLAFKRVLRWRIQERSSLVVTQGRCRALIVIGSGPLDALDGVMGDGVSLAEVIEQGGQRRELAPDGGRCQLTGL